MQHLKEEWFVCPASSKTNSIAPVELVVERQEVLIRRYFSLLRLVPKFSREKKISFAEEPLKSKM
jgi:hypothetical protein